MNMTGPDYNMVLTKRWMLVIPRSSRVYSDVDVNAMGFLGALLVKGDVTLQRVQSVGPMAILQGVAFPSNS